MGFLSTLDEAWDPNLTWTSTTNKNCILQTTIVYVEKSFSFLPCYIVMNSNYTSRIIFGKKLENKTQPSYVMYINTFMNTSKYKLYPDFLK